MDIDKISKLIKQKRKEKCITQADLAQKLNVTEKAISRWETGRGTPDISLLIPLSKELGIDVSELLNGKENKTKSKDIENIINYIEVTKNNKNKYILPITIVLYAILLFLYLGYLRLEFNNITHLTFLGEFIINSFFAVSIAIINYIFSLNYFDKNEERKEFSRVTYILLLVLYCIMFFNLTIFSRTTYGALGMKRYNLIPFKTIISYISRFDLYNFKINIIGNIVILMPLEYFMLKIFNIDKFKNNLLINIILVASIEFLQFITGTGILDIDDIILNVFGMSLIYFIVKKFKFNRKNIIITIVTFILTIGALFIGIIIKEKFDSKSVTYNANINIEDLGPHSQGDVEDAISVLIKEFRKNYKGCKLKSITYDYNLVKDYENDIKNEEEVSNALVFKFKFKSGFNSPGLNSNSDYTYSALFIKENNKWKLINQGQG